VDAARLRARLDIGPDEPILLVLPGSRPGEIASVLPAFAETAARLNAEKPGLRVLVPVAQTVASQVEAALGGASFGPILLHGEQDKWDAMGAATAALACSGTVTTELAQAGCPFVVGYRASALTYLAAKLILKTRWLTLLNIAAGAEVVPEFIQGRCEPGHLSAALRPLLFDPQARARQLAAQAAALAVMRGPQAQARPPEAIAADVVSQALSDRAEPR
jgi:lipid-A-disaccharide synthase